MSSEDSSAGQSIGRTLELARKERGLSLKQVEQATKIRARYLRELERENFGVLPAVYVQGSLKTYASFLQLDAEALTGELRRRQAPWREPQYVEPPRGDYFDRSLIFLGGAAGAGSQEITEEEEDAGAASISAGGNLIYLASAALLVLVLVAVALALTLPSDGQPAVSQVREPLISQAPSQMSRVVSENDRARPQQEFDGRHTDDESDSRHPEQRAGAPDEDAQENGGSMRAGQDQSRDYLAQSPRYATATPSASPIARREPAVVEPEAPSTPPPAAVPDQGRDQGNATGAPVRRSGGVPPPNARDARRPGNAAPEPRGGGSFDVQIVLGSDDPVRITGDPVNDR